MQQEGLTACMHAWSCQLMIQHSIEARRPRYIQIDRSMHVEPGMKSSDNYRIYISVNRSSCRIINACFEDARGRIKEELKSYIQRGSFTYDLEKHNIYMSIDRSIYRPVNDRATDKQTIKQNLQHMLYVRARQQFRKARFLCRSIDIYIYICVYTILHARLVSILYICFVSIL